MRWLFLLLLMLNGFYYLWHQQEAPLRVKEVLPLSLARAEQQNIHLLSESEGRGGQASVDQDTCLYIGGFGSQDEVRAVEQRLMSLDVRSEFRSLQFQGANTYWLKIDPVSRRLVGDGMLKALGQDFAGLKNKIMLCEGIATAE